MKFASIFVASLIGLSLLSGCATGGSSGSCESTVSKHVSKDMFSKGNHEKFVNSVCEVQ